MNDNRTRSADLRRRRLALYVVLAMAAGIGGMNAWLAFR